MVVSDAIHNIMGGMESTAGVRLHNHRRKLKQRFDIIKKLGQGTYGKVQLGINKETGQEVAIKTIKKSKIETEADLIRIRREIQIMSSVQHPNIIHIYEVFENREKMVLVMEYAAGGELYDFLSERKVLVESEARRIFRQISTAVYYCHKHKICHRDLKLENILLDEHGSAKIADFGLSNVFDSQHLLGTFCGSPLYASPEIVKGTPYRGPEVDCWSLGVLLYTLVYGAMPFDGSNFKRLVKQISQGDYFEPKKPSPASALIRDMLHIDPALRADIVKICSHWWLNEGEAVSCVAEAEELANQTPVRLDLLLSLAPPPTPAEAEAARAKEAAGGEAGAGPTRSQSVGSLMELDHPHSYDAAVKRRASAAGQEEAAGETTKRKLEEGSSTDQANHGGAKRKDRSRHRDRSAERTADRKQHRSSSRSKQPKPVPKPDAVSATSSEEKPAAEKTVVENKTEAMEVDEEIPETRKDSAKATPKDVDEAEVKAVEAEDKTTEPSLVLEAKAVDAEENKENVESLKEESKASDESKKVKVKRKKKVDAKVDEIEDVAKIEKKEEGLKVEESMKSEDGIISMKQSEDMKESSQLLADKEIPKVPEDKVEATSTDLNKEVVKPADPEVKETKVKVVKKIVKKKSDLGIGKSTPAVDKVDEPTPPTKPMVRRRSKIFESEIQKFNQMAATELKSPTVEKPKKVFIPGVKVSDFKRAYERKSSVDLSSTTSVPARVKTSPSKKDGDSDVSASESSASASVSKSADKELVDSLKKDIELAKKDIEMVKDVAVNKDDVVAVKKPEVGAVKKEAAVKKADLATVKKDDVTVKKDDVTVKKDVVPVKKVDVPTVKKVDVASNKTSDVAPVKKDGVTVTKDDTIVKKDDITDKKDEVKKNDVTVNKIDSTVKDDDVTVKKDDLIVKKDGDTVKRAEVPVKKAVVAAAGKPDSIDKPVPEPKAADKPVERDDVKPVVASEATIEKPANKEEEMKKLKKNAIEIIGNAIAKPPKPLLDKLKMKGAVKSPSETTKKAETAPVIKNASSPLSPTGKKFVKIQVGPNDVRNAVLQVSTPEHIQNFNYNERGAAGGEEGKPAAGEKENSGQNVEDRGAEKPDKKVSSKVEITLKSATLPRRKTSKAEIQLGTPAKSPAADKPGEYRSEVEHMVGVANPSKLRNQRSEVAFPVAAASPHAHRSVSVEPEGGSKCKPRERIIPIQFEREPGERPTVSSPPPSKPPAGPLQQQRSLQSQRSSSLSRQSTLDSDSESAAGGPEPIRKSPREFIIPIAVEGGGYVTPRAGSLEPGPDNAPEKLQRAHRFSKPMRMGSLLSDGGASEDEGFNSLSSPFSSLNRHRDGEDEFGLHMHRLRSTRPSRPPTERADSGSSGEEDDDDGFELLTAESLFSTLLSRVRNLTQRLNVDEGGRPAFPTSRFMNHNFPSHSSFFGNMEPLSRRVSESTRPLSRDDSVPSWRRSASRDQSDCDSVYSESGNSNATTLPRGSSRNDFDDNSSDVGGYYTPSMARRMQRTNQEPRPPTNQGQYLPPYSTLPSRRPISRTTSLKTNDDPAKRKNHLPPLNANYIARSTDNVRKFNVEPQRYSRVDDSDGDLRRSCGSMGPGDQFGSTDSLKYAGRRDYSRDRSARDERDMPRAYQAPTRRTVGMLNGGSNALPRRQQYRSSMSDTDYSRKPLSHLVEEGNGYDREATLPPQGGSGNARRENGVQKPTSYLRQRAIDIANIYGAPLSAPEPTRLERDSERDERNNRSGTCTPTNQSSSNLNFYDDKGAKYVDKMSDFSGERGQPSMLSRFRSGSLNRESGAARETASEAIIRRQKSYDKLGPEQKKLRRPVSLDLRATPDKSVLSKFFRDADGKLVEGDPGPKSDDPNPARSPGRKVSRFLRPDFYDTPREDSVFAKEKDEAIRVAKDHGNSQQVPNGPQCAPRSKQANIASFLELNYADLERNIAKDLLAISENANRQNLADTERKATFNNNGASFVEKKGSSLETVGNAPHVSEIDKSSKLDSSPELSSGTSSSKVSKMGNGNVGNNVKPQAIKKIVPSNVLVPTKHAVEKQSASDDTVSKMAIATSEVVVVNAVTSKQVNTKDSNQIKSKSEPEPNGIEQKAEVNEVAKLKVKKRVKKADEAENATQDLGAANVETKTVLKKKVVPKTETGSVSNKNKFLRSLDKTIEKFKSSDNESNSQSRIKKVIRNLRESSLTPTGSDNVSESNLIKRAVSVDDCSEETVEKSSNKIKKVIKSLKELATSTKTSFDTENNLLKRATSIDDLSNPSQTKSNQVNSVLGKFKKLEEPKADKKVSLLTRFRRTQSVYAGSSSDGVLGANSDGKNVDTKMNRMSLGFDNMKSDYGEVLEDGLDLGVKKNENSKTDLTPDVSVTMRIKAPKKEVIAEKVENGISNADDVSLSATVKVVKVVGNESIAEQVNERPRTVTRIPQTSRVSNGETDREERFKDAQSTVYPGSANTERRGSKIKHYDPISTSSVLSEDDSESFDSCSIGSDWDTRTTSPLPPYHSRLVPEGNGTESIEDRIRRKSFYSRFNDPKKKQSSIRKSSVTGIPTLRDAAPRRSSSFVNYDGTGKPV